MEPSQTEFEQHQAIQLAAYYLWQQRGYPFGTPEVDWFQAEEQLHEESAEASQQPALVAVAAGVGAVLGSVAGLVASVGNLHHSDEA